MTNPDIVNGLLELCGSFFIMLNIIKLYKDKKVNGVSRVYAGFFTIWGYWNLYYYPFLDQWISFFGGILIVITNTIWLGQLIYYTKRSKNEM